MSPRTRENSQDAKVVSEPQKPVRSPISSSGISWAAQINHHQCRSNLLSLKFVISSFGWWAEGGGHIWVFCCMGGLSTALCPNKHRGTYLTLAFLHDAKVVQSVLGSATNNQGDPSPARRGSLEGWQPPSKIEYQGLRRPSAVPSQSCPTYWMQGL